MSQARYYESNPGPLKLEHDLPMTSMRYNASPRDYRYNPITGPTPVTYPSNNRYKGFPGNSFQSPRVPILQPGPNEKKVDPTNYFGRITLFDKVKPRNEGQGLLYGSDKNPHKIPPAPKPKEIPSIRAVPFGEDKQEWQLNPRPDEIERRRVQQLDTQREIERYQREQAYKKQIAMEEKKKDYERSNHFMLDNLKHGHGSFRPDGDYKKKKFQEEDITPKATPRYRDQSHGILHRQLISPEDQGQQHPDFFLSEMNRQGGRENGRGDQEIQSLRGDGIIKMQEQGRKSLENQFQHNRPQQVREEYGRVAPGSVEFLDGTQYRDKAAESKEMKAQDERIQVLRADIDMLKAQIQPGGGMPNRSLTEDRERFAWERRMQEHSRSNELKSLDMDRTLGGAGAPVMNNGVAVTRNPITLHTDGMGVSAIKENIPKRSNIYKIEKEDYVRWGKPGAGAPILDAQGRQVTQVAGKLHLDLSSGDQRRKTRAARLLNQEYQREIEEQRRLRKEWDDYNKAPIGEFGEIIRRGRVGRPKIDPVTGTYQNQHLGTSDVSRLKMNKDATMPEKKNSMNDYYNFLTKQAQEREYTKQLDRLRDDQEWKRHNDAESSYFGRPGGGAPKGATLKKESLANTLFSPRQETSYAKEPRKDFSGVKFVKSNTSSNSANMYEMPEPGPVNGHYARSPFALNNY